MKQRQRLQDLLDQYDGPAATLGALERLLELLARPEAPTAVHDPDVGVDVHIADSLAGLNVEDLREARVIADLGAGAGLPGLVLAAVLPGARVVLVESVGRKCAFLRGAASAMGLENVDVVGTRAEEWEAGMGACDAVCARAVAALPVLCEYAAPLLREGGVLVAWKGAVDDDELADAVAAARHLGLAPEAASPVSPYAGSERRTLHVLRKTGPTPAGFPRRPGMAAKRPLSVRNLR